MHKLHNAGASFSFIVDKILEIDNYLASQKRDYVYKLLNLVYNKFKNNTLYKQYSNLAVLLIPNDKIDTNINKYFYKISELYIALNSTTNYYNKYILTKDQFLNYPSETIIDKLYCKRLMRWFDIDDLFLISQAENTVKDINFSKNLYQNELAEIDRHYIKYYRSMHTTLLNKLSIITE